MKRNTAKATCIVASIITVLAFVVTVAAVVSGGAAVMHDIQHLHQRAASDSLILDEATAQAFSWVLSGAMWTLIVSSILAVGSGLWLVFLPKQTTVSACARCR